MSQVYHSNARTNQHVRCMIQESDLTNVELAKKYNLNVKTISKGSFPTEASAFKVMYLAIQEQQEKWNRTSIRNWYEIYPQLSIFFSEIMSKYTK